MVGTEAQARRGSASEVGRGDGGAIHRGKEEQGEALGS